MENVESFYPLSPMQQGMLFHSLFDPSAGLYVEILSATLTGNLDVENFRKTWQKVLDRHSILRTAFIFENVKEPIQVVYKQVTIPFDYQDWRGIPREDIKVALENYLNKQHRQGFKLSKAPLVRIGLLQTAEQEFNLVVIHHHILLDGWSIPLLLREILMIYTALTMGAGQGAEIEALLSPVRPYRDYILWLKKQNVEASEAFWKNQLAGFTAPTPITVASLVPAELTQYPDFSELEIDLSKDFSTRLTKFARQLQVTQNALFQAAWALLLSRYSGEEDILFGVTVSGRPTDLPGSESMIGLFINSLPFRVTVPQDMPLSTWMKQIHSEQAAIRDYEYTPLVQIQGWSDIPRGTSLFDSLLVFENLPVSGLASSGVAPLDLKMGSAVSYTNFPITVVIVPSEEIVIKISYSKQVFDPGSIERMIQHLKTILEGMLVNPDQSLGNIPTLTPVERSLLLEEWNNPAKASRKAGGEPVIPGESMKFESRLIHQIFEKQAAKTPGEIALTFEGSNLSYQELNQRANHLAHYLRSLGVGLESMVGIFMERSHEVVIAILAILKAGGAYVPLDPVYPADRLAFIVDDYSNAMLQSTNNHPGQAEKLHKSVLITQQKMLSNLPATSARLVCIDSDWDEIIAYNNQVSDPGNPDSGVQTENLAYVIYTSGSTGRPKGCMITHHNVVRLFEATDHWYHFNAKDVWTLFHSYAFDFSVWEIWGALFYGGRLVVVPYFISRSPDAFYQLLLSEGVTVLNQTPSAFRQLIRAEEVYFEAVQTKPIQEVSLRYVIFGGEALELQSLKPWFQRHGDQQPVLVNMYGITETTVHVTYRPIFLKDLEEAPGSVIGVAIPDLRIYIVDKNLEPVPIGVPGELLVGGEGVARGYLNRPELNSQRFLSGLFNVPENEKIYRSGDLARYLPDGDIEYLGRIDHQVKIRGFRIELGEIESLLVQTPGVQEAVVLAREDSGHKRLIAYLVPKKSSIEPANVVASKGKVTVNDSILEHNESLSPQELRRSLGEKLPDYMIPASFVLMDSFPLTTNGKINRQILLDMDIPAEGRLITERDYIPPLTQDEITMANLWKELLGIDRISLNDNFFELGGDSILSIQLISRAKQAGFQLSYIQLFENPVLSDLLKSHKAKEIREFIQEETTGKFPLTPVQHWFFEHHADAPEHFNTSIMLSVWEGINTEYLKQTFSILVKHHDQLRVKYVRKPQGNNDTEERNRVIEWEQSIVPGEIDSPLLTYFLGDLPAEEQKKIIEEKATEIQTGFRLDEPPLVRMAYFNLGNGKPGRLLFVFHHLVTDGVSMRIFMEDFMTVYMQFMGGLQPQLPPKTLSYMEWAKRLEQYANSEELKLEQEYWRQYEQESILALPVDNPDGQNTYGVTDEITLNLDPALTDSLLHQAPVKFGCRVYDILLYALGRTVLFAADQVRSNRDVHNFLAAGHSSRILIELEGHGREEVQGTILEGIDLSRTMGWFTSIFPLYLDVSDGSKVLSAISDFEMAFSRQLIEKSLQHVFRQVIAIPNRGFGYGVLKYLCPDNKIRDGMRGLPEAEINFNYLGQFDQTGVDISIEQPENNDEALLSLAPESSGPEQNPDSRRNAKLYVVAIVNSGQLAVRWLYSRELHNRSTILEWAEHYMDVLRKLIVDQG